MDNSEQIMNILKALIDKKQQHQVKSEVKFPRSHKKKVTLLQ